MTVICQRCGVRAVVEPDHESAVPIVEAFLELHPCEPRDRRGAYRR